MTTVVRGGRIPFQIFILVLLTVAGFPLIFGASSSDIVKAVGEPYSNIWGFLLFIGGFSNLLGIYWPKSIVTGMLIEKTGLVALGGASLVWSGLVLWRVHWGGLFTASLTFGLFVTCVVQFVFLSKQLKKIEEEADG